MARTDSLARRAAAAAVHLYTASGAALAYFGLLAAVAHDFRLAFGSMLAATLVDATDGLLARAARVRDVLPGIDGARLDDVVDYVTFVFLPMAVLSLAGDLAGVLGGAAAATVLVCSAWGFSATDAKTPDHFFSGFPSYWNIVALYLHVGNLALRTNAIVLLILSALIFVRVQYVYPSRTPTLRGLTVVLGAVWAVMVGTIVWQLPGRSPALIGASLFYPVYYTALSLILDARRRTAPA